MSRRQEIVDAAETLFAERGYHHTSMQDLGEATGMLRGSLYAHIQSKDELLVEIVQRAAAQFLDGMAEIVHGPGTVPHRLREAFRHHVRVVTGNLAAAAVFLFEWRHLPPDVRKDIAGRRDRYEGLWRSLLSEGQADGTLSVEDPAVAAIFLLSAGNWLAQWYRPGGRLSADQVADQFFRLAMDGIGSQKEAAS